MKWNVVTMACCLLLLVIDVSLLRQNRQLKAQLSAPAPGLEVQVGRQVPDLEGFDVAGKALSVRYGTDSRKTLVLVFSPTCQFCAQNWPRWKELMGGLDQQAVRPIGVDVTSTSSPAFLSEHDLSGIPVFLRVPPQIVVSYRFQVTPQTILVDSHGKVEKVWSGVLNDSMLGEIKKMAGSKV
jgi:peroxiredoxin